MKRIDPAILDTPVEGINLRPISLRDQLDEQATLLVFLRHFGWVFCREGVKDLRRVATSNPSYPAVLFFYQGSAAEGEAFFSKYWPGARAFADSSGRLYRAFGLGRGGIREMFGPRVWAAGLRAVLKGNLGGAPTGDPWTMPGLFLVKGDAVIWEHRFRHVGDQPEFARIAASIPPSR